MTAKINNDVYDELANAWWDENGFLNLLKVMVNPWRVPYFKDALISHSGQNLTRVRLLDIGCGGGLLTEEFARMGCKVTGIDPSTESIKVAEAHAANNGLSIDYRVGSGTSLPFEDHSFEAVSCCDVLEHIRNWKQVIAEVGRVLVPGGLFLFDTINRTLPSRLAFIYGLQDLPFMRLMPRNTHVWDMFIKPDELQAAIKSDHMIVQDLKGSKIAQNPVSILWAIGLHKVGKINYAELGQRLQLKLDSNMALNYLGYARKGKT